ncbi:MAG: DUF302 domain-containing protein [Alphaproteobacteria bacterium]|nr:DUF302 domain-containing protein [Alphaproteobacteria bacterium]
MIHCRAALIGVIVAFLAFPATADNPRPYPGTQVIRTAHSYQVLVGRLDAAVKANKMGVVTRASATEGAKKVLKMDIPGNMVVGVFHPRFAVRMLKASVPAGVEAPLRFYITANADNTATLTYRKPSSVFAPYENAELDKMAEELDAIFAKIAEQTIK